ncbi:MAG TPA: Tol-Pal system protein TolB [Rhabdochlamydiaceae bacterium]|jgi:TolB protein
MKILLICTLFFNLCFAQNSSEIRVHLATQNPLHPIYVGRLDSSQASLPAPHLNTLQAILAFDLNYNGSTKVCASSVEKEELLAEQNTAAALNPTTWKNHGISYVLQWKIAQKTLSASLLNAQTGSLKSFGDIPLSGDLNLDRRQIHKLADGIYKALFNKAGIAHSRILFAFQVKSGQMEGKEWVSEIWECDWDGANLRQITQEKSYCVHPVLLPQNQHYGHDNFLYVSYKQGQPKIYIASLKEGVGKRLIDLRGNQLLPAVSRDRDKIAFICDAAGRTDLFIQPLHPSTGDMGKPYQLYSYPRSTTASPTFSPDGSKVAFVSDKDSGMRIYIIPALLAEKRHNAVMISKQSRENSCPAWSPDGTKLAYSAKTNGIRQIWIYDFGSKEEWQLTSGPGNKENPAWAPDSAHIVFNSTDDNSSELYVVNLNQPEAIRITRGSGKKHYPTWGFR